MKDIVHEHWSHRFWHLDTWSQRWVIGDPKMVCDIHIGHPKPPTHTTGSSIINYKRLGYRFDASESLTKYVYFWYIFLIWPRQSICHGKVMLIWFYELVQMDIQLVRYRDNTISFLPALKQVRVPLVSHSSNWGHGGSNSFSLLLYGCGCDRRRPLSKWKYPLRWLNNTKI